MLDSVTNLAALLKDPSLLVTKAYVAGQWIDADAGTTFEVTGRSFLLMVLEHDDDCVRADD